FKSCVPREGFAMVRPKLCESGLFRGIFRLAPKAVENLAFQTPNAFVVDQIRLPHFRRKGKYLGVNETVSPRHTEPIGRGVRINVERLEKKPRGRRIRRILRAIRAEKSM